MQGYITAHEAAKRVGLSYAHFLLLVRKGKVERALEWYGYAFPDDISRADLDVTHVGRPKKRKEMEAQ